MMEVLCVVVGLSLALLVLKMVPSIVRYTRISRM